jgi:hypothetical protein
MSPINFHDAYFELMTEPKSFHDAEIDFMTPKLFHDAEQRFMTPKTSLHDAESDFMTPRKSTLRMNKRTSSLSSRDDIQSAMKFQ